ncbi:MAG: recombinase family protein [Clostridia bacterium]|nr:recombinase family protein [Clostridia bacterium]
MLFGYMRVSSKSQDSKNGEARQKEALLAFGVEEKNLFYDVMTGKDMKRPQLEELKKYLREGDSVVVSELSRLGRDTKGVITLVEELHENGVSVISLKENITFDDSPMGRCFLPLVSALSQLERELINERCQEGRELAK